MERQKSGPKTPAYPDLQSFFLRHPAGASAGILICALSLACGGALADTSSPMADSGETATDETVLLPAAASHRVWLSDGISYVDYQVEILVSNTALADWMHRNQTALQEALDATLAEHPLEDFDAEERNLDPIQDELMETTADTISVIGSAPEGSLDGLVLTIAGWGMEKIDGDMG
jgi:hypothetical protein